MLLDESAPPTRPHAGIRETKMKYLLIAISVLAFSLPVFARGSRAATGTGSKMSSTHVSGHVTKNGTYVAPHERSTPDHSKTNNWSTKGNRNPYTGKEGTK